MIELLTGLSGATRCAVERELGGCGILLPIPQRAEWQHAAGVADSILLVARDENGTPLRALSAGITTSRTLPGHRLYRVERFTPGPGPDGGIDLLSTLAALVRCDAWSLRAVVEVFERDSSTRKRLAQGLAGLGFRRSVKPRVYARTLTMELGGSGDEIFGALSRSARRNVRAAAKRGFQLRPIHETSYAPRLEDLMAKAFRRTGELSDPPPWEPIIELSTADPSTSRVVGLFDGVSPGMESLVAFAWGCCHGTYATYEAGAAVRRGDLGNAPLGYAPLWDLISWARDHTSALWFDLGGVDDDRTTSLRRGISEFKQYFSEEIAEVGEEWLLEPHGVRAAVARRISAAVRVLSDMGAGKAPPSPPPPLAIAMLASTEARQI